MIHARHGSSEQSIDWSFRVFPVSAKASCFVFAHILGRVCCSVWSSYHLRLSVVQSSGPVQRTWRFIISIGDCRIRWIMIRTLSRFPSSRPCIRWSSRFSDRDWMRKQTPRPTLREELDTIAPRTRREIKCQKMASLLTHSEAWTQRETKNAESRGQYGLSTHPSRHRLSGSSGSLRRQSAVHISLWTMHRIHTIKPFLVHKTQGFCWRETKLHGRWRPGCGGSAAFTSMSGSAEFCGAWECARFPLSVLGSWFCQRSKPRRTCTAMIGVAISWQKLRTSRSTHSH